MEDFLIFILFISVGFLAFKLYKLQKIVDLKKETVVNVKIDRNNSLILRKQKENPTIEDIDTNYQLLKDVIESAKLEKWHVELERESLSNRNSFTITNPTKTITISARLYADGKPTIVGFRIKHSREGKSISYSPEKNPMENYLILEFLWDIILEENDKEFNKHKFDLTMTKETIEKELISLRRNKQLEKLL